ncbi:MAG: hypothetical protein ACPL8I_02625 [Chloroflexaceae bacterium]
MTPASKNSLADVRLPAFHWRWPLLGAFVGAIWTQRSQPIHLPGIVADAPGGVGLILSMIGLTLLIGVSLLILVSSLYALLRLAPSFIRGENVPKPHTAQRGEVYHQYRRAYESPPRIVAVQILGVMLVLLALTGGVAVYFFCDLLDRYGWLFVSVVGLGMSVGALLGLLMPRVAPNNAAWDWGVRIGAIIGLCLVALLPLPVPSSPGVLIGAVLISLSALTSVSCGIGLLAVGLAMLREQVQGRP